MVFAWRWPPAAASRRAVVRPTSRVAPSCRSRARLADADDGCKPAPDEPPPPFGDDGIRSRHGRCAARNGRRSRPWRRRRPASRRKCRRYARPCESGWQSWAPSRDCRSREEIPRLGEQRRRRTDHDVGLRPRLHRQEVLQRLELGEVRGEPMHLPVAGDERPDCGHRVAPSRRRSTLCRQAVGACGKPLCSLENGALPPYVPLPMMPRRARRIASRLTLGAAIANSQKKVLQA